MLFTLFKINVKSPLMVCLPYIEITLIAFLGETTLRIQHFLCLFLKSQI